VRVSSDFSINLTLYVLFQIVGPGVRMALSLFVTAATGQVPLPLSPSSIPVEKVQEAAVQTGSVSNQSSFLILSLVSDADSDADPKSRYRSSS